MLLRNWKKAISDTTLQDELIEPIRRTAMNANHSTDTAAIRERLCAFEGAEGIYREGPILARVKVQGVRVDDVGMSAEIVLVRDYVMHWAPQDAPSGWQVQASWEGLSAGKDSWGCPYAGWYVFFDPALIPAMEQFCNTLPDSYAPEERLQVIHKYFGDCRKDYTIRPADVEKYTVVVNVTGDWVSSRDPNYPANSASQRENRFNRDGDNAYYIASGVPTMEAEVPKWEERETYRVAPATIHAFDLASWSRDNGCHENFLRSKEAGGYGVCQRVTDQLTGIYGLSGILYNSEPMHAAGSPGSCLVILPPSGSLVDNTFFVRDYGAM